MKPYALSFLPALVVVMCHARQVALDESNDSKNLVENYPTTDSNLLKADIRQGLLSFTLKFMKHLAPGEGENVESVVMSPFSFYSAFAVALLGSAGQTEKDLKKFMEISHDNQGYGNFHETFGKMEKNMVKYSNVTLFQAAFVDKKLSLKKAYKTNMENYYDGIVQELDFKNKDQATMTINRFVSDKTNGRIPQLLSYPVGGPAVLLNTMFFKSEWSQELLFDKTSTAQDTFYTGGQQIQVAMMRNKKRVPYVKNEKLKFQSIGLKFRDGIHTMYFVLPDESTSAESLAKYMDEDALRALTSSELNGPHHSVEYFIPRIKVKSSLDMGQICRGKDECSQSGIAALFKSTADFTNMVDGSVQMSNVVQGAEIEITETGTIASSATAITLVATSGSYVKPIQFKLNRPFLFYLHCKYFDGVLFSGVIRKPISY